MPGTGFMSEEEEPEALESTSLAPLAATIVARGKPRSTVEITLH